jgi:hypothetical protein
MRAHHVSPRAHRPLASTRGVPSDAVQQAVEPELEALPTHEAGPAVAAAGVILAGTFAALIGSPPAVAAGFAVALGVLLAAFVMAWVLVPSLTALLGRTGFWPDKTSRIATEPDAAGRRQDNHRSRPASPAACTRDGRKPLGRTQAKTGPVRKTRPGPDPCHAAVHRENRSPHERSRPRGGADGARSGPAGKAH